MVFASPFIRFSALLFSRQCISQSCWRDGSRNRPSNWIGKHHLSRLTPQSTPQSQPATHKPACVCPAFTPPSRVMCQPAGQTGSEGKGYVRREKKRTKSLHKRGGTQTCWSNIKVFEVGESESVEEREHSGLQKRD